MTAIFEVINRETFIAKLRELAVGTESLSLLADPKAGSIEISFPYLNMFGGNRVEAKESFDCDLSNLISDTLAVMGVDELTLGVQDYLSDIYDTLDDVGICWV